MLQNGLVETFANRCFLWEHRNTAHNALTVTYLFSTRRFKFLRETLSVSMRR